MVDRCPLPPISENPSLISSAAQVFGTDTNCNDKNGPTAFTALWNLLATDPKNSSGCEAVAQPLSLVVQATSVTSCQIVQSSLVNEPQPVSNFRLGPGPSGIIRCASNFVPSQTAPLGLQCSVNLDAQAQQEIANVINILISNLIQLKASRNSKVESNDKRLAAVAATKDFVTPAMVNEAYIDMIKPNPTQTATLDLFIPIDGTIAGLACTLPLKQALQLLMAQNLSHTLANKAASLQPVVDFNELFVPNESDDEGASAVVIGVSVGVSIIVIIIIAAVVFSLVKPK